MQYNDIPSASVTSWKWNNADLKNIKRRRKKTKEEVQNQTKELRNIFDLDGHTVEFHPQTQTLQPREDKK